MIFIKPKIRYPIYLSIYLSILFFQNNQPVVMKSYHLFRVILLEEERYLAQKRGIRGNNNNNFRSPSFLFPAPLWEVAYMNWLSSTQKKWSFC